MFPAIDMAWIIQRGSSVITNHITISWGGFCIWEFNVIVTTVCILLIIILNVWHSHPVTPPLTSQNNTIQVALITNGVLSFIDLLYLNPETWKLSDSIQMGLNSGLESDSFPFSYFTLPNMPSRDDNVWSNTGAPGEWFFRVDTTVALQPQRMLHTYYPFTESAQGGRNACIKEKLLVYFNHIVGCLIASVWPLSKECYLPNGFFFRKSIEELLVWLNHYCFQKTYLATFLVFLP